MSKKKVIFLPFINGPKADKDGRGWRNDLEESFKNDPNITGLTDAINEVRNPDPNADNDAAYYQELHARKTIRQREWLQALSAGTAALFENSLNALPSEVKNSEEHVIVAALPEFFWCDINDNKKHTGKDNAKNGVFIEGYHKPIYKDNLDILRDPKNPIARLTNMYNNLIFFCGTVMWKEINPVNHKDEKIFNTMFIYYGGAVNKEWSKCIFSPIDGFNSPEKEGKKGELGELDENGQLATVLDSPPSVSFHGLNFAYDICCDFIIGKDNKPISSGVFKNQQKIENSHVNVLIAAGMKLRGKNLEAIKSPIILRCDGNAKPFAEIAKRCDYDKEYPNGNSKSISGEAIIGVLDTVIDTEFQDESCCSCIIQ